MSMNFFDWQVVTRGQCHQKVILTWKLLSEKNEHFLVISEAFKLKVQKWHKMRHLKWILKKHLLSFISKHQNYCHILIHITPTYLLTNFSTSVCQTFQVMGIRLEYFLTDH